MNSPSELLETQGGEIPLTNGHHTLINQSCYVVQYTLSWPERYVPNIKLRKLRSSSLLVYMSTSTCVLYYIAS